MQSTNPIWPSRAGARLGQRLAADIEVDVAVVGGGITGLTTALWLSQAGKRVALLEARQLGAGVTGASTAHLTEAVDTRYHTLESQFGREAARLVRASSRDAIESIGSLADGQCGFQRVDGYLFTERERDLAELDAEFLAAERAGVVVTRRELPLPISARGVVCFENQAQIDPSAYVARLAERLRGSLEIYEQSAMAELHTGGRLRVVTPQGASVTASAVVLATHAPPAKLPLQLKLSQYRSYVVACEASLPTAALFWDTEDPYHYLRGAVIDGKSYVLVGGADHRTGEIPDADAPFRDLAAYAARLGWRASRGWSSQVVESADGLPFIGKPDPDVEVYVATGFGGNGTTLGTIAARVITDSILGVKNRYAELYRANRLKPLAAWSAILKENAGTALHAIHDRLAPASHEAIADLGVGAGRIFEQEGQRLAVYRDPEGQLHALAAVCTHMGCQVAFNALERSWDCPCHGSRFDIDGQVLDGPATRALEQREVVARAGQGRKAG